MLSLLFYIITHFLKPQRIWFLCHHQLNLFFNRVFFTNFDRTWFHFCSNNFMKLQSSTKVNISLIFFSISMSLDKGNLNVGIGHLFLKLSLHNNFTDLKLSWLKMRIGEFLFGYIFSGRLSVYIISFLLFSFEGRVDIETINRKI